MEEYENTWIDFNEPSSLNQEFGEFLGSQDLSDFGNEEEERAKEQLDTERRGMKKRVWIRRRRFQQ